MEELHQPRIVQKGPQSNQPYSVKKHTVRSFPSSTGQYRLQNKNLANKVTGSNEFSSYSSKWSSISCSDSYDLISGGNDSNSSSNVFVNSSRINKARKKSSRKKSRWKGKQNNKLFSQEVSSDKLNHSSIDPKSSTFNIELDVVQKAIASAVPNLDIGIQVKDQQFSILDGNVTETRIQISCYDDRLSSGFSNMTNSQALDSLSVGSKIDGSNNANNDVKSFEKERSRVCSSKSLNFNSRNIKGTKLQNFSCNNVHLLVLGKREKQIKILPSNYNGYKFGNGRTGKENNHSIWKKVQRNDADDCNCELRSQFEIALKEVPLLKRNCNVPVNEVSRPEDAKQPKIKASKNSRRKITLGSKQVYDKKEVKCVSKPCTQNGSPRAGFYNNRVKRENPESIHISRVFPDGLESFGSSCTSASDEKNDCTENLSNIQPHVYPSHLLGCEVSQIENEITSTEHSKKNCHSASTLQKWIPTGLKVLTSFESSLVEHFDRTTEEWSARNIVEVKEAYSFNGLTSSLTSTNEAFGNVTADCLMSESKTQSHSIFEAESIKIAQAMNDTFRTQLASEAVQMVIGGPIAEFERVLHFSSPVISQSPSSLSCQTCLRDQFGDALLCKLETPDVPLGCVWQWYEKHGSYGLQIKAEDFENSRLGVDHLMFRAYFVPYLSAVQLFKSHENHCTKNTDDISASGLVETCEISEKLNNCNISHFPISSILVPQPRATGSSPLIDVACSGSTELLFEYFESDQPRQRQPLYEKIQELVQSDETTRQKMYGDPSSLVSVNLCELHPRSWYSVAWYPVYRIPDGNFRAAFLTYHSLGHFVRRGTNFCSSREDGSVVSPVLGLQSYNAQNECWFRLRKNAAIQTTEIQSRILKERLRTLEETASLIATAVVNKGNETSVNRHPDYEFFLSRRRYRQ